MQIIDVGENQENKREENYKWKSSCQFIYLMIISFILCFLKLDENVGQTWN